MTKDQHVLSEYIPQPAVEPLVTWLHQHKVQLRISKSRNTKLGDFRPPRKGELPRISVNHNLNTYAFLITLVHEMAHVEVWENRSIFKRYEPHGKEWQNTFSRLMNPFLHEEVFPASLLPALKKYFLKPKASSVSDANLMRALKAFDAPSDFPQLLEMEEGQSFYFKEVPYRIIAKRRTRFQCQNLENKRMYLIHGLAQVEPFGE